MSSSGPLQERVVKAVLLSLWNRSGGRATSAASGASAGAVPTVGVPREVTIQQLLQDTLAPLPDLQQALDLLTRRRCLIERTPSGLRLVSTALPCWSDLLEHIALQEKLRIGRRVMVFLRTGSTNDIAWQFAANRECDGLVVVADEQSAGRGRLGHAWHSRPEQSILLSVLLREVPDASVDRLTLLAGLAAVRAIEEAVGQSASSLSAGLGAAGRGGGGEGNMPVPFRVEIKWPNDLLVQGRKLAGILVERRPASRSAPVPPDRAAAVAAAGLGHVVIGIGINVAQAPGDFEPELRARATSLYQATGAIIDRLRIVAPLLRQLDACFGAAGSPAAPDADENVWMPEWKARCGMLGSRIRARSGERLLTGQVLDVAPMQGLILRDDLGATHFLSAQTTTIES